MTWLTFFRLVVVMGFFSFTIAALMPLPFGGRRFRDAAVFSALVMLTTCAVGIAVKWVVWAVSP